MFGEFFCSLLGQDKFFYKSLENSNIEEYKNKNNRWLYPEYLSIVNFHAKTRSSEDSWHFDQNQINTLTEHYNQKNILVPTHWYQDTLENIHLPTKGIRLYCSNQNILLLSYVLFWIKSHIYANNPWPNRIKEIKELITNNHKHSKNFQELLLDGRYHNWKFLSYKNDWLLSGKTNLSHYMMLHWIRNKNSNSKLSSHWYNLDIGDLLYGDTTTLIQFEKDFSINLDRNLIDVYKKENIDLVQKELEIEIQDLAINWHFLLSKYSERKMNYHKE